MSKEIKQTKIEKDGKTIIVNKIDGAIVPNVTSNTPTSESSTTTSAIGSPTNTPTPVSTSASVTQPTTTNNNGIPKTTIKDGLVPNITAQSELPEVTESTSVPSISSAATTLSGASIPTTNEEIEKKRIQSKFGVYDQNKIKDGIIPLITAAQVNPPNVPPQILPPDVNQFTAWVSALADTPEPLSIFVPYTGALKDVDLGPQSLSTNGHVTAGWLSDGTVTLTGGVFDVFPKTPTAAPFAQYDIANKKYVDDIATTPTFLELTDTISSFENNRILFESSSAVIHSANLTFDGTTLSATALDIDTLNLNGNVISDSTGTISFDDENLTTTGAGTFGDLVTINQSADYDGLQVNGFDDMSGEWAKVHVDSAGNAGLFTSGDTKIVGRDGTDAERGFQFTWASSWADVWGIGGIGLLNFQISFKIGDDKRFTFGTGNDYSMGYHSASDEWRLVDENNLSSNIRLAMDSTGNFDFQAGNLTTTGTLNSGNFKTIDSETGGSDNVFIATNPSSNTGANNIFIGDGVGTPATTGENNVGVGASALESLTEGGGNFALGAFAGRNITTGDSNVAIGTSALATVTTTSDNTAIGTLTLNAVTGVQNVAVGRAAGRLATTADQNTYIGHNAAEQNTSGDQNVVIGNQAGQGSLGSNYDKGVILGYQAGEALTSGNSDIFIGYEAGKYQTTTSNLLLIGNQNYGDAATELTNSIIKGVMAATPAGQSINFNVATADFGSGNITTTGTITLGPSGQYTISGDANSLDIDAENVEMFSSTAQQTWKIGRSPTEHLDITVTDVDTTITLVQDEDSNAQHNLIFDATNTGTVDSHIQLKSESGMMLDLGPLTADFQAVNIVTTGDVGIGTVTPATKLHVTGTGATDIIRSDNGLDFNPVNTPTTPTATAAAGAGLEIGDYYYYVTFYTALGETNVASFTGSPNVTTTGGNQQVEITNLPVSSDYRVVGRVIYRGQVGIQFGAFLCATIANNIQTTYTDNLPDASLGATNFYYRINSTTKYITSDSVRAMVVDERLTTLGISAGAALTTGGRSTFVGSFAGDNVTTGVDNTYIGHSCGSSITGSSNVAVGTYALVRDSGGSNTSIGAYSGFYNTGDFNTFLGQKTGYTTTGSSNVFLGHQAGYYETGSSKLFIDNAARTNESDARIKALMYGVFDATAANQTLAINVGTLTNSTGTFDFDDENLTTTGTLTADAVTIAPSAGHALLTITPPSGSRAQIYMDGAETLSLDASNIRLDVLSLGLQDLVLFRGVTDGRNKSFIIHGYPTGLAEQVGSFQIVDRAGTAVFQITSDTGEIDLDDENLTTTGTSRVGKLEVDDAATYIDKDGSGNMTLTDTVIGTRTLKQLGCPTYKYIKATTQSEGDLHLSDGSTWAISKSLIKVVRVITSSTDWDLYVLQNDNGFVADDANIPKFQIMEAGNGDANIHLDLPYEDEDASSEVHLYYLDNSGANTADIYVIGFELV